MTEVRFYDSVDDSLLKFAVIIARTGGQWVFCKHRDRDTYEIPGGHREPGEAVIDTARRELYEETGALDFSLKEICVYSVTAPDNFDGQETFGKLFFAEIRTFEKELHSEIEKIVITEHLADKWTYPQIQPKLLEEASRRGFVDYRRYPTKAEAEALLAEAESCNPGPWGDHSRTAAHCAEAIAARAGMDADKAYVLGLLHDIGRKFGKRHLGHVSDGYSYMMSLGYADAARICLTHSFNEKMIEKYVGRFDTTDEETELIRTQLAAELDDYDRLIQLCDAISGAEGVMDIIDRMTDVKNRYGSYDPEKWNKNLWLKEYFESKMGTDLYTAVDKENFRPR